jgi:hypothetical protein
MGLLTLSRPKARSLARSEIFWGEQKNAGKKKELAVSTHAVDGLEALLSQCRKTTAE